MQLSGEALSATDQTALISKCIKTKNLKLGRQIHSQLIKTAALTLNTFLTNRLMEMYSKCNSMECAQKIFDDLPVKNSHSWNAIISAYSQMGWFCEAHQVLDKMSEPNLVSYNSIISGLNQHGFYGKSINLFKRMQKESGNSGLWIDEFTVVSLVNACACLESLRLLSQIHGVAIMGGFLSNVVVCNALIDAYGKCSKPEVSYVVFLRMREKDVVSWTSMVVAFAKSCRLADACQIFYQMPDKNVFAWSALITGFAQNGQEKEAMSIFVRMLEEGVVPSAKTYVSVLSACADLALIERGKQVHGRIVRSVDDTRNVYVVNALVDMYCKCGDMKFAMTLFERFQDKDVITWNSVITGFAQNGQAELSLTLFKEMIQRNVQPNYITFLGVLSACNHTGLLFEGLQIFNKMKKDFGVTPRVDHYAILVDLLGRKNQLRDALELIEKDPDCSDHIGMWGALLNACRVHGNSGLARRAEKVLFELEPENAARYVMLSNIYTAAGWWNDARRVRRLMDDRDLRKEAAYSCIEVRSIRHEFVSKDNTHTHIEEILELLIKLADQMKDSGYLPMIEKLILPEKWSGNILSKD